MSLDLEQDWLDRKAVVKADIDALLAAGFTLETARRLAGWNPTLDYDTFTEVSQFPPPPGPAPTPVNGLRDYVKLVVTRAPSRLGAVELEGAALDAGKLYAIYFQDVPDLDITQVVYLLDGSNVHTEYQVPWDYAGTDANGDANRVTFIAGTYEVEAQITATTGPFSVSATFVVD